MGGGREGWGEGRSEGVHSTSSGEWRTVQHGVPGSSEPSSDPSYQAPSSACTHRERHLTHKTGQSQTNTETTNVIGPSFYALTIITNIIPIIIAMTLTSLSCPRET